MELKKINLLWSISLCVIGIASIILAGSNIMGIELPDTVTVVIGVIDLIAIPVLTFSTVRKFKNRE